MITNPNYYDKNAFLSYLSVNNPDMELMELSSAYDVIFDGVSKVLHENPDNRFYVPKIGTIHSDIVPANEDRNLPERIRFRLSCKPFIRSLS